MQIEKYKWHFSLNLKSERCWKYTSDPKFMFRKLKHNIFKQSTLTCSYLLFLRNENHPSYLIHPFVQLTKVIRDWETLLSGNTHRILTTLEKFWATFGLSQWSMKWSYFRWKQPDLMKSLGNSPYEIKQMKLQSFDLQEERMILDLLIDLSIWNGPAQ